MTTKPPLLEDHKTSSYSIKREGLKENNNNTSTLLDEKGVGDKSNGVVVVSDDDSEDAPINDSALPTPRTEAYRLLSQYGVSTADILPIIRRRSDSEIQRLIAYLDFVRSKGKRIDNPCGWLAKMARKDDVAIPDGAEAAYRRRFLGEEPEEKPAPATPPEPEPWERYLATLPEAEQAALRRRAQETARRVNPGLGGWPLKVQIAIQLKRLVEEASSAQETHDEEAP